MRYDFVERHRGRWPVRLMCRVLRVSPGGYYDWRGRPRSERAQRRAALVVAIKAVHGEVKARYGSPRIHAELVARGEPCCVNTVARLMRREGIAAKTKRKFRVTTDSNHDRPVAENVLNREFEPEAPNQAWTADITYVATGEGWLYLAAVEDLHSRRIVGWSMGSRIDSRLVVDALEMALAGRRPGAGLVAHSDRGSQYASEHYQGLLGRHGITCSMSRVAQCWDNAPVESFFATLKRELVHSEQYTTREQAQASIFEYIEAFYNRVRRHSSLGYGSPAEFERTHNPNHP
jgi:putative transposase